MDGYQFYDGLNIFLFLQVLVDFAISFSLKFYTNLIFYFLEVCGFSSSYQILLNLFDI